ncbi:MAG: hypothetical protein ACTTKH_08165 [Treponema sp.]
MKIIYKALVLCLLLIACKMPIEEKTTQTKKSNILEHTKWKSSAEGPYEADSVLDFHTSTNVIEYITLHENTAKREGTYKINRKRVFIKWGKLLSDRNTGIIVGNIMEVSNEKGLKVVKYYKIEEY